MSKKMSDLPIVKIYTRARPVLLKSAFLLLLGAALTGATTSDKKPSSTKLTNIDAEEPGKAKGPVRARPYLTKDATTRLIRSAIPSWRSPVLFHLCSQLVLLTIRALLTIRVASLDGKLVAALINKRTKRFLKLLINWMLLGIPASVINALLQYTQSSLSKSIRTNITFSIMSDYLPVNSSPNYYSLIHLGDKISDPDQRISTDIDRLARAASSLPGQLLKPSLDLLLCAKELSKSGVGGPEGTLALGLIAHFSTLLLTFLSPPFAKLASERASLEGQLRSAHSKVVQNNEQIAFLRGHPRELDYLDTCYYQLQRFSRLEFKLKAIHDVAHTFIVKYTWGALGLLLCSVPVFINKYMNHPIDESTSSNFITNRRLLVDASSSLGRLLHARRYVAQVVGHASRVGDFQTELYNIKNKISNGKSVSEFSGETKTDSNQIGFYAVPLITPANVVLCSSLNFVLPHGHHLLIAGPNGCGKSSLFRILGGLWPVRAGTLITPSIEDMFYLPQRAYLSKGTLREQIIYPHTLQEFYQSSKTDDDLISILRILKLEELLAGSSPLDQFKDWVEELSIGSQQKLAMARLYYNKPKFAVLDECTSAVSPTMEQFMYKHAQSLGISLLSVAHRPALWHFHDMILKFDGKGGYFFGKLDAEKRLKYEEERLAIEKHLREIPALNEKLKQLKEASKSQHIKRNSSLNLNQMQIKS